MLRELGIHGAGPVRTLGGHGDALAFPKELLAPDRARVKTVRVLPFAFAAQPQIGTVDGGVDFAAEVVECDRGWQVCCAFGLEDHVRSAGVEVCGVCEGAVAGFFGHLHVSAGPAGECYFVGAWRGAKLLGRLVVLAVLVVLRILVCRVWRIRLLVRRLVGMGCHLAQVGRMSVVAHIFGEFGVDG